MTYGARELRKTDKEMLQDFIEQSERYHTLLMRSPARAFDTFKGWWMGAFEGGTNLQAVACVEDTAMNIYGNVDKAIEALANEFLRRVMSSRQRRGTHQILGDQHTIELFWSIFRDSLRKVIHDRKRLLYATSEPNPPLKSDLSVSWAGMSDFKLVYEFTGLQSIDVWGSDPRRTMPAAHEEHCMRAIQEQRQLITRHQGKPILIAQVTKPEERTIILDRIYLPKPYRARKKLAASALIACTNMSLSQADEVTFFADQEDTLLNACASMAGFEEKCGFRLIVMRA